MAEIVVLGAGLGGTLMAFELGDQLRPGDRVTLIGQSEAYQFVPSNPWVAVGWRKRKDIEVHLASRHEAQEHPLLHPRRHARASGGKIASNWRRRTSFPTITW